MPSYSPGRGFLVVVETENSKIPGKRCVSTWISVDLPTPDGPTSASGLFLFG